ncbi:MAG: fatty acid desaturase [Pseudomonadota bacterium]
MRIEWPTLALIFLCYAVWGASLTILAELHPALAILALIPAIALQSSLQHEVLHGHPFGDRRLGEPLVFATLNLSIPYIRFRDTHLEHHRDANLTDPYEDPESNYLDPATWARLPRLVRAILSFNNTLLGRMLIGPAVAQVAFMRAEWALIRAGRADIARAWLWHTLTTAVILTIVALSPLPIWAYLTACYLALSVLKIRTFLEHQAHDRARGRTVIIEDRGPLALLFLNNNLHVVHHMHPKLPWYRLPQIYAANRDKYLRRNDGYQYASYTEVFRRHFLRAKDPVPHPLYPQK